MFNKSRYLYSFNNELNAIKWINTLLMWVKNEARAHNFTLENKNFIIGSEK